MLQSTDETNANDPIHYFKSDTPWKKSDDFGNKINLFEKIKSGDMKLEEVKKLQNVFK